MLQLLCPSIPTLKKCSHLYIVYLICTGHCSNHFTYINPFNSLNSPSYKVNTVSFSILNEETETQNSYVTHIKPTTNIQMLLQHYFVQQRTRNNLNI